MDPIKVDLSGLKIKDLALFEKIQNGATSQADLIALLDRVVVGGASELPLTALGDVMQAIREAMGAIARPQDGQGKA